MTSASVAHALLRELDFCGGEAPSDDAPRAFVFKLDFEPHDVWPDLAYDTSSAAAHPAEAERGDIRSIVDDVARLTSASAPKAFAFVNAHLTTALACRSEAVAGASSASNRERIGACVLTNLQATTERVLVGAEALVHESVHQCLYKIERDHGNFCDLGEARTYRSFWSGQRIPLHSLIHACFVWYGLLTLWCQLAGHANQAEQARLLRDRASRVMFGFAFVRRMFADPAFPLASIEPEIVAAIDRIARSMPTLVQPDRPPLTLRESLVRWENGDWVARLSASLRSVDAMETKSPLCGPATPG